MEAQLKALNQMESLYYSSDLKDTFNQKFINMLERDRQLLFFMYKNYQIEEDKLIDVIFDVLKSKDDSLNNDYKTKIEKTYEFSKTDWIKNIKDKEEFEIFSENKITLEEYKNIQKQIIEIRNSEEYYKKIKELKKVDFYSKQCSIKGGFMFEEALKEFEKLKENEK